MYHKRKREFACGDHSNISVSLEIQAERVVTLSTQNCHISDSGHAALHFVPPHNFDPTSRHRKLGKILQTLFAGRDTSICVPSCQTIPSECSQHGGHCSDVTDTLGTGETSPQRLSPLPRGSQASPGELLILHCTAPVTLHCL